MGLCGRSLQTSSSGVSARWRGRQRPTDAAPTSTLLRYGVGSSDVLAQRRPLSQVKQRGRLQSVKTLRRYAKAARSHEVVGKMPPRRGQPETRLPGPQAGADTPAVAARVASVTHVR